MTPITKETKSWSNTSDAKFTETDLFQKNGKSIRDKFVLPILGYYDDSEKIERQKIIDKETNLKKSNIINE